MANVAFGPQMNASPLSGRRVSWRLWVGLCLLALGVFMPIILPIEAAPVLPHLVAGLRKTDSGHVLLAAAWLVGINTIRALPIFLGGFLIAEGVGGLLDGFARPHELGYLAPLSLIPLTYAGINYFFGLDYHFGTPALLGIAGIFAVHRLAWHTQGTFNKMVIFVLFLFGLQWLHIVPALSDYGFGAGSISSDIKRAALVLGAQAYLTQIAIASSAFTMGLAFVMSKSMVDQTQHLRVVDAQQRQERELLEKRIETMAARTAREVENLVHDLKTPLAGVQSLMRTMSANVTDERVRAPLLQTESVIENMLHMVSETLSPELQRRVPAHHLFDSLRVQFAPSGARLHIRTPDELPSLRINTVRVTRAIANLIQNALESNIGQARPVKVKAGVFGGLLRIRVRDYGDGIPKKSLRDLGAVGFTTKASTGLGIPFATGIIVAGHDGNIDFISRPGLGTLVIIELPLDEGFGKKGAAAEESIDAADATVLTPPATSANEISRAPDEALARRRRILAIDDDPAILLALHFLAEEAGWELVPCQSATDGIKLWQQGGFDIALLDYRMPKMDGWTALRHMRRHNNKTPILMLTVDENASLAQRLLFEGANDFILKPIKPIDLMARLRLHLREPRQMTTHPTALGNLKEMKGVQPQTLDAIVDCIRHSDKPLGAAEIAEACSIATPTAYRYLTLLEQHAWIVARMEYGAIGRPRKLYQWFDA